MSSRFFCSGGELDAHVEHVDARLPVDERIADLYLDAPVQLRGVRLHHEVPDAAAEFGPHDAFARARAEDDLDRFLDRVFARDVRNPPVAIRHHRKRPAAPEEAVRASHR
jgi:hypothetical protein